MKPQRIVILGMGRSGTTFLTEFLGKCGVFLDEVNWAQEHELARLINDTFLEKEFGARPGQPYGKLPATIHPAESWQRLARQYVAYMDAQAQQHGATAWAFKDPRTTVLHEMWLPHFDLSIGIFRAPEEVVASYVSQKWITGLNARRLALDYWLRFNRALLDIAPTYLLNYNADMTTQTEALCAKIGARITPAAAALFNRDRQNFTRPAGKRSPRVADLYRALTERQL